jgi:hypothetical protein
MNDTISTLNLQPNFHEPGRPQRHAYVPGDAFLDMLQQAHAGLSPADSELLNARLVLVLANHIGNLQVLRDALRVARPASPATEETTP